MKLFLLRCVVSFFFVFRAAQLLTLKNINTVYFYIQYMILTIIGLFHVLLCFIVTN